MDRLKPNFFIIGAPKSGTTSLHEYLNRHSQITMSKPKEPHYFSSDIKNGGIRDHEKYLNCFSHGDKKSVAIGESSTLYLYSKIAGRKIYDYNKDAKFIIMLRNPSEIARSFHQVALKVFGEIEIDFEKAWSLQNNRKLGKSLPGGCIDQQLIIYGDIAKIGVQVERLLSIISLDKIHFVLYDDFKNSTEFEYFKILNFLNVDKENLHSFNTYNKTYKINNSVITKLTNYASMLKKRMRIKTKFNIANKIHKINVNNEPLDRLPRDFLLKMDKFFDNDVCLLSKLIKKDLSKWRTS